MKKENKRLTISPTAWAKIRWFMKKAGNLEISGFGITEKENPLTVIDFQTVSQENTSATTELEDMALAKHVERNARRGVDPSNCMRVWIHTHPFSAGKPSPSSVDISTLEDKLLRGTDYAIMIILGGGEEHFAELHAALKIPGIEMHAAVPLTLYVDWTSSIWDAKSSEWNKEYKKNIKRPAPALQSPTVMEGRQIGFRQNPRSGESYRKRLVQSAGQQGIKQYIISEWIRSSTILTLTEYNIARTKGYTPVEILRWGRIVEDFDPLTLRAAEVRVTGKKNSGRKGNTRKNKNKQGNKSKIFQVTNKDTNREASLASMGLKNSRFDEEYTDEELEMLKYGWE